MTNATPARSRERLIVTLVALSLPSLSLVPLGGLYLLEHHWLLIWAISAFVAVSAVSLLQYWLLSRHQPAGRVVIIDDGDRHWTPDERRAWLGVQQLAATVSLETLGTSEGIMKLAQDTITVVAKALHTGAADAVWQFTLPEALAISEQVSRRLSDVAVSHVPFGDRLTVAQLISIYRGRQWLDLAGRMYDVWRLVRIVNPATALTNEARERLAKSLVSWGREHIGRRLVSAYVEEVGRAAIGLYGSRLRTLKSDAIEVVVPKASAVKPASGWRQAMSATRTLVGSLWRPRR